MARRRLLALALAALALGALPGLAVSGQPTPSPSSGPAEWLVQFDEVPAGLRKGSAWHGGRVTEVEPELGFAVVRFPARPDPASWRDPRVLDAREDLPQRLIWATPSDPSFNAQYGPQKVRAPLAWDVTFGNATAAVCVIDTGIDVDHPDLAGQYVTGHDFVQDDAVPNDQNGHGTHVAGIAAAAIGNGIGIAGMANVAIYAARVLDGGGSGTAADVASGIAWCADNTPDRTVINLSLGFSCRSASTCSSGDVPAISAALQHAAEQGKLIVAASGNDGCGDCVGHPARHPAAIAVGCTTSSDALCSFSSRGPKVEVSAPGQSVLSTVPPCSEASEICAASGYASVSGTSMSSPHVAGLAALLWSHEPGLTAADLRERLGHSVHDLGTKGRDDSFGWGRADAACLLGAVANAAPDAVDDAASTFGRTLTLPVLANDADAACSAMRISAVGTPALGTVTTVGSQLRYVPTAGLFGLDEFTYTVSDGVAEDTATVAIEVLEPPPCDIPGPDATGYRCSLGTADLPDITTTGTLLERQRTVPIGFKFGFYGRSYTRVVLDDQGVLGFAGVPTSCCDEPPLPGTSLRPNLLVSAGAGDLLAGTATIRTELLGEAPHRVFVAQWNGLRHEDGGAAKMQVALHETTEWVDVRALGMTWSGPATVGIDDRTGAQGVAYAVDRDLPGPFGVRFWRPIADLALTAPTTFAMTAASNASLDVTLLNQGPNATTGAWWTRLPRAIAVGGPLPEGCTLVDRLLRCEADLEAEGGSSVSIPLVAPRATRLTLMLRVEHELRDTVAANDRALVRVNVARA